MLIVDNRLVRGQRRTSPFFGSRAGCRRLLSIDAEFVVAGMAVVGARIRPGLPRGQHIVTLLPTLSSCGWFLRQLKIPGAWVAGLVFAVHPVNVATVAWISEQKNTLSMLFSSVAILSYLKFVEDRRWRLYGLSLVTFSVGIVQQDGSGHVTSSPAGLCLVAARPNNLEEPSPQSAVFRFVPDFRGKQIHLVSIRCIRPRGGVHFSTGRSGLGRLVLFRQSPFCRLT